MTSKRLKFLEIFLKIHGVQKIEITKTEIDRIFGEAIFEDNEKQKFCWHSDEHNVPLEDIQTLLNIIILHNFHIGDKIIGDKCTLFIKSGFKDKALFDSAFEQLFDIEVKMIDDEKETDSFFLHT